MLCHLLTLIWHPVHQRCFEQSFWKDIPNIWNQNPADNQIRCCIDTQLLLITKVAVITSTRWCSWLIKLRQFLMPQLPHSLSITMSLIILMCRVIRQRKLASACSQINSPHIAVLTAYMCHCHVQAFMAFWNPISGLLRLPVDCVIVINTHDASLRH